jgi:hypothetical protein
MQIFLQDIVFQFMSIHQQYWLISKIYQRIDLSRCNITKVILQYDSNSFIEDIDSEFASIATPVSNLVFP